MKILVKEPLEIDSLNSVFKLETTRISFTKTRSYRFSEKPLEPLKSALRGTPWFSYFYVNKSSEKASYLTLLSKVSSASPKKQTLKLNKKNLSKISAEKGLQGCCFVTKVLKTLSFIKSLKNATTHS